MPLYEYECTACHRRTEKIQKFSDAEITVCPHCGGGLERVISAPAIAFKGGGWYADGYGNAKPATPSDGKSGESKAGESKGTGADSKTESKPSTDNTASAPAAPAATAPTPSASISSDKK